LADDCCTNLARNITLEPLNEALDGMSAMGQKLTSWAGPKCVRFTPENSHGDFGWKESALCIGGKSLLRSLFANAVPATPETALSLTFSFLGARLFIV